MNESNIRREPILRWSIGTKLIIALLALAIIPMSITAYYNLTQGRSEVVKVAKENLIGLSRSTAHRIGQLLVENQRTSATLAGEPLVAQFLAASEEERQAMTPQIYQTLKNFADTHPDYDAPGLLDVNGIVVASLADILVGKDRSFRDYFQASIKGKPFISDMLVGRATGRPGVFLTNPVVTEGGKIVGIDIVWLKGDTIWDIIDDVTVGNEGIAYLVDQDGVIIAHPNRNLLYHSLGELTPEATDTISKTIRFGTIKGTKTTLIPESLGMDEIADELVSAQGYGTHRYYSSLDHRSHVVGYTPLEAHPWTVVVDLPEGQFLAPMQRLRSVAWISVGLVGVITLIISILLVRGITRPIHSLTDTAIAVEQGQPFSPSDIEDVTSGRDEIAHMGRVFSGMVLALRQELKERKRADEALRESELRYKALFEGAAEGVLVADIETQEFKYANPAICKMLGYTEEELIVMVIGDLHPKEALEHVISEFEVQAKGEKTLAPGIPFLRKDGSTIYADIRTTKVMIGGRECNVGLFADITERKQAEEELAKHREHLEELIRERTAELEKRVSEVEQLNSAMVNLMEDLRVSNESLETTTRQLGEANKELEAFSYSVSHDLRAPLRSVDGFSQILLEDYSDTLDEKGKHYLDRARAGTQKMGQLIDDILNLSRIGRQAMKMKKINMESIAREVYNSLEDEWKGRKVDFNVHKCPTAAADLNLINIVFMNLLSNALKFTGNRKEAKIEVGSETKDEQTVFFVKDNGVGFDMKYADKLFTPFQRLHRVEEYEGAGIGLAIVQRIIHRHGGRIWVESKVGKGTTFYFTV
jgi:PAS domain S-box-containing protein